MARLKDLKRFKPRLPNVLVLFSAATDTNELDEYEYSFSSVGRI